MSGETTPILERGASSFSPSQDEMTTRKLSPIEYVHYIGRACRGGRRIKVRSLQPNSLKTRQRASDNQPLYTWSLQNAFNGN